MYFYFFEIYQCGLLIYGSFLTLLSDILGKHYTSRNASKNMNQNSYKCLMLLDLVILLSRIYTKDLNRRAKDLYTRVCIVVW